MQRYRVIGVHVPDDNGEYVKFADIPLQPVPETEPKGGPISSERWTLGKLLKQLENWRTIAGEDTCVSFENLCFGASSLWHQTHRENFRKIDIKPDALSRWVLEHYGSVAEDFPAQVLAIFEKQLLDNNELNKQIPEPLPWLDQPDRVGFWWIKLPGSAEVIVEIYGYSRLWFVMDSMTVYCDSISAKYQCVKTFDPQPVLPGEK